MDDSSRHQTLAAIQQLKEKPAARTAWIPVFQFGRKLAWLEPVTRWDLDQEDAIALLSQWRPFGKIPWPIGIRRGAKAPGAGSPRTSWKLPTSCCLGQGTGRHSYRYGGLVPPGLATRQVAIDNVVRGQAKSCGMMYSSMQTLLAGRFQTFGVSIITVQVESDNVGPSGFSSAAASARAREIQRIRSKRRMKKIRIRSGSVHGQDENVARRLDDRASVEQGGLTARHNLGRRQSSLDGCSGVARG